MNQELISIIINCHNGAEFLQETLNSVKQQSYSNYEIVFYDNFSDDDTADIAKGFGDQLKYFKSEELLSLGAARNEAIKKANGDYVAFLDSDDLWENNKLEKQVDVLNTHPDVGMVMTNVKNLDMLRNRVQKYKETEDKLFDFESFVSNYAFCLSSFMVRRKCFDELTFCFDERLHYAEEYDIFLRIGYKWKAYFIGTHLTIRRMHDSMNTIKLAERIPVEHQYVIDNMRKIIKDIDEEYPQVIHKISYLRDYMDAKAHLFTYSNKKIRQLVYPYIKTEKRALEYYVIALFPKVITNCIFRIIYKNHI